MLWNGYWYRSVSTFKCRNSDYRPHETAIINKQIKALEANGFIEPDNYSPFMSRIVWRENHINMKCLTLMRKWLHVFSSTGFVSLLIPRRLPRRCAERMLVVRVSSMELFARPFVYDCRRLSPVVFAVAKGTLQWCHWGLVSIENIVLAVMPNLRSSSVDNAGRAWNRWFLSAVAVARFSGRFPCLLSEVFSCEFSLYQLVALFSEVFSCEFSLYQLVVKFSEVFSVEFSLYRLVILFPEVFSVEFFPLPVLTWGFPV